MKISKLVSLFALLFVRVALASTAGVSVDNPTSSATARTYQMMVIQLLNDAGISASDSTAFRAVLTREAAIEASKTAALERLFVLHGSPIGKDATLMMLEEVDLRTGAAIHQASLTCSRDIDTARTLGRLVRAVVARESVDAGQRIETMTEAEAQPYSKKPGEFLNGLVVRGGGVAVDAEESVQLYGGEYQLLYELPHVNFGASIGAVGGEHGVYFDVSVRANYLFSDGDFSGFIGGGLGFAVVSLDDTESDTGGSVTLSGGVEMFRLHSARMLIGLDLKLPTFTLDGRDTYDYETSITTPGESKYPLTISLGLGVLF